MHSWLFQPVNTDFQCPVFVCNTVMVLDDSIMKGHRDKSSVCNAGQMCGDSFEA